MRKISSLFAAFAFFSACFLSAATRIDDPKTFVAEVYRRLMASQKNHSYSEPDDIYTPRLRKLILDDRRKAGGEVGCLEIDFWIDAQDYEITKLSVTTAADETPDRKTVIAKFHNLGRAEEIHFDFRKNSGLWQLDDVHSMAAPAWTLSELLKCAP